jgi:hypothetical protein
MPMVVHVGIVLMHVSVLAGDMRMGRGKSLAEPFRDAGEIQNAEQNQHQPHREFHGQTDARGNHHLKKNDGGAYQNNGDGVTQSPKRADQRGLGQGTFAAHDRGDRDDVVGIRGMAHAEKEPDG